MHQIQFIKSIKRKTPSFGENILKFNAEVFGTFLETFLFWNKKIISFY